MARRVAPILILAAAVLLAGCGSSEEDATESTQQGPEARGIPGVSPENLSPGVEGCRSEIPSNGRLIATGVRCAVARAVASGWNEDPSCAPPGRRSRSACTVEGFRCLSISADRGIAVSCSRPERSVAFIVKHR